MYVELSRVGAGFCLGGRDRVRVERFLGGVCVCVGCAGAGVCVCEGKGREGR